MSSLIKASKKKNASKKQNFSSTVYRNLSDKKKKDPLSTSCNNSFGKKKKTALSVWHLRSKTGDRRYDHDPEKVGPACRVTPCGQSVLLARRPLDEKREASPRERKGRRNLSFIQRRTPLGSPPSEARTRKLRLPPETEVGVTHRCVSS